MVGWLIWSPLLHRRSAGRLDKNIVSTATNGSAGRPSGLLPLLSNCRPVATCAAIPKILVVLLFILFALPTLLFGASYSDQSIVGEETWTAQNSPHLVSGIV